MRLVLVVAAKNISTAVVRTKRGIVMADYSLLATDLNRLKNRIDEIRGSL